jgi:hypothetical protein
VSFFLILLKVITIFSPLRIFLPISLSAFVVGAAYAAWTIATQVARDELVGAAHPSQRRHLPGGADLGADFVAAIRGAEAAMTAGPAGPLSPFRAMV